MVVKSHGGEVETVGKTDNRNVVDRVLAVAEAKHDDHEENEVVDADFIRLLEDRLRKRAQDDEATIAKRVAAAKEELSHVREADYLVINDLFEAALFELRQIISASRLRALPQLERHLNLAKELGVSK